MTDTKTTLRGLKVGDPCLVVTTGYRASDHETIAAVRVTTVGRRWLTVTDAAGPRRERFDRDDGLNDTAGNYRHTPRVTTQAMLEAARRRAVYVEKCVKAFMRHGWWSGDHLSTRKLERIVAILEEP